VISPLFEIVGGIDEAGGRAGHPKKSRGLLREGIDMKFAFIAKRCFSSLPGTRRLDI
jgi:hypothetical protein